MAAARSRRIGSAAPANIFSKLFFSNLDPATGLIASFATFGVGFVARPLGGLFFGTIGDKLGRKWVLIVTIVLMGGASTLVGALPTYETIGVWAPILLVFLRLCQGFGAGAEQAGATVLMAEYSPVKSRGFFAALPFIGIQAGTLLAAGVFAFLGGLPEEVLLGWAWRVPFLSSIVLILIALFIRVRLKESPTFVELEKHEQVANHPLREIFSGSFRNVLKGIGLRMAENGGSYMFNSLAVAYATGTIMVSKSIGPIAVAVASLIGMISVPLAGYISDRVGRVPVYRFGAIVLLVLAFPGWYLISLGNPVLVIVVIAVAIGFGVNTMLGAQCALLPEMFGNKHRYLGVAISRSGRGRTTCGPSPRRDLGRRNAAEEATVGVEADLSQMRGVVQEPDGGFFAGVGDPGESGGREFHAEKGCRRRPERLGHQGLDGRHVADRDDGPAGITGR